MAKTEKLVIRCSRDTKQRFREFFVKKNCKNYEEALNSLLDLVEPVHFG